MSIFSKIKTAIFGEHGGPFGKGYIGGKTPQPTAPAPAPAQQAPRPAPSASPAPAAPAAPAQPVDVDARLRQIASTKGQTLDWQHSIVDLMKLLDLDSSLANRKELATELGYTGAKDGSAEMNLWLHKRVMDELRKNNGQVPGSLAD